MDGMAAERGRRPPRGADRLVEQVLSAAERPLSTYEIRDRLLVRGERVSIPLVYRAVARLMEAQRIRRVELLNSYMMASGKEGAIAVCRQCSAAIPVDIGALGQGIAAIAQSGDFEVEEVIVEVRGRCARCRAIGGRSQNRA